MFSNQNTNPVERQLQQNNTTLSSEDLLKHMQSLEKRIKSLEVTNRVILGLFIGTLAAAITVGAGFAIAAAPIIAGSIVGGILATVALAALGVNAYKYRAQIKEGFKYAAEKTVDGAKYTAGKVRDGAVHVRDSVKEAVSSVGQATREGTSSALRAMGDGVQKLGRKMSNSGVSMSSLDGITYSIGNEGQTVVLKTEEKTRNFNSVKEMFIKEVLEDKAVDNSVLIKKIFSELKGKILEKAYSVDGQSGFKKDQLINQLTQQADFINKLDAKKLQNLLSKDNNSLYEIFSEYHDEIKEVIRECKEEHKLSNSIENLNEVAGKYGIRKGSMQSIENSSSRSSSMSSLNSVRTDSTISSEAELLNHAKHKEVKAPSSLWDRVSSPFKSGKKSEKTSEVKYQVLSESDTLPRKIGNSTFYVDTPTPIENTNKTATIGGRPGVARRGSIGNLTRVGTPEVSTRSALLTNLNELNASSQNSLSEEFGSNPIRADNEVWYDAVTTLPDKGTLTHSNSTDSGMGSGSSTPKSPSLEDLSKARAELKKTGYLDKLVGQPSTQMAVEAYVHPQLATTQGATNVKA